jgi:dienelactone hydrolase
MQEYFQHLGSYSDIVSEAQRQGPVFPLANPGKETQEKVHQVLGWNRFLDAPLDVKIEKRWERDGLDCEHISWSVGYGPRTEAWIFKPRDVQEPLPAVLALHDHGGFKYTTKEKIADGPKPVPQFIPNKRANLYGGRAWVNALAKEGFVVLVHDVFLWGSRRFSVDTIRAALGYWIETPEAELRAEWEASNIPAEVADYNYLARHHEHIVAKYLNLLGTNLAGVINFEDRLALRYLRSRPDVQAENVACMGLSGGGARAGLLRATADGLKAAVVVGMMSTYPGLLDHNIECHTWIFFPSGWARHGDWPDLVACQAPAPLLVQYDQDDDLFTPEGMQAAHDRLRAHYTNVGAPEAYTGRFFPGPHKFDIEMQAAAFAWLKEQLERE